MRARSMTWRPLYSVVWGVAVGGMHGSEAYRTQAGNSPKAPRSGGVPEIPKSSRRLPSVVISPPLCVSANDPFQPHSPVQEDICHRVLATAVHLDDLVPDIQLVRMVHDSRSHRGDLIIYACQSCINVRCIPSNLNHSSSPDAATELSLLVHPM